MKKLPYLFVFFILNSIFLQASEDWGKTGHRATGEIAEKHLTKRAKKEIDKLLSGHSIAFVSNFADEIKSDRSYSKYYPWHYVNFPFYSTYDTHPKNESGDLIVGIETCITILKNEHSTRAEKVFHLKMLIHLIGDLHQPLHNGLAEDRGGNDIQVEWFNEGTNLHTVWDTKMIETYNMSYTELASNTKPLSANQIQELQKGTVIDWMYESKDLCEQVYDSVEEGEKLRYRYSFDYMDTVLFQIQKGGIRLAAILNAIYS